MLFFSINSDHKIPDFDLHEINWHTISYIGEIIPQDFMQVFGKISFDIVGLTLCSFLYTNDLVAHASLANLLSLWYTLPYATQLVIQK